MTDYPHLKGYAQHLLAHQLDELVALNLQKARQVNLPLLSLFAHLTEEQVLNYSKNSFIELLVSFIQGEALPNLEKGMQRWKANQISGVGQQQINARDLVLSPHTRKYAMLKLIRTYTRDLDEYEALAWELDAYYTQVIGDSLEVFVALQQEELRQQKDFFELVIDHTLDGISAYDTQLKVTLWNRALEKRTGIGREEILGKPFTDFFPSYQADFEGAVAKGETIHLKDQPLHHQLGYYEADVLPLTSPNGILLGSLTLSRNITEHKQTLDELRKKANELQQTQQSLLELNEALEKRVALRTQQLMASEEELRQSLEATVLLNNRLEERELFLSSILDQSPVSTWIADTAGTMIRVNQACLDLFGVPEDSLGVGRYNLWQDETITHLHPALQNVFSEGKGIRYELDYDVGQVAHLGLASGKPISLVVTAFPVKDAQGKVTHAVFQHEDATERKKALRALRQSQLRLQAIFQQTIVGIAQVDTRGQFLYVNDRFCDIAGRNREELLTLNKFSITHPEDRVYQRNLFEHLVHTGQWFTLEKRYLLPNGTAIWVQNNVSLIPGVEGEPDTVVAVCQDITERKNAQLALIQREEQLRLITDALPVLISYVDQQQRYQFVNRGYEQRLGFPRQQICGQSVREVLGEKAYQQLREPMRRALEGETLHFEILQPYPQEDRFVAVDYIPHVSRGQVQGFYALVTDITEQKQAEQALQKSEARFRFMADAIPQLVWTTQPGGVADYANERWLAYTGLSITNTELDWQKVLHPDDAAQAQQLWQLSLKTGRSYSGEYRLKNREGSYWWMLIQGVPMQDERGNRVTWFGTCTDIHAMKQAEEAIQLAKNRLETVVNHAPVVLWALDEQGIFTLSEGKALERLGLHPGQVVGQSAWELYRDYPRVLEGIQRALRGEQFTQVDEIDAWAFEVHYSPLWNAEQRVTGVVGVANDITERKSKEVELLHRNAELERVNTDMDNFIYTASHDLKAPIANLEGLLLLLHKRIYEQLDASEKKMLQMAQHSVTRLTGTIRDLTEIAKVQKDREAALELLRFEEEVAGVLEDVGPTAGPASWQIVPTYGVADLMYSRKSLRSILFNLLSNAVKYRADNRPLRIAIQTSQQGNETVLVVEDNGLGMAAHQQARLFTMFKRFHTHVEGSGIGLYMIKRMIENNGGQIEVESREGQGTRFTVRFRAPTAASPET